MSGRPPPYPGTPLWAEGFGTICLIVFLLFFIVLFTVGPHGGRGGWSIGIFRSFVRSFGSARPHFEALQLDFSTPLQTFDVGMP
jgi:hypothetical protein